MRAYGAGLEYSEYTFMLTMLAYDATCDVVNFGTKGVFVPNTYYEIGTKKEI